MPDRWPIAAAFYESPYFKAALYFLIAVVVARVVDELLARRDRAMEKLLKRAPDRSERTRFRMVRRIIWISILFVGAAIALSLLPGVGSLARAMLASAAISALVLPLRVGDVIGTDGGWVRNFPLGHAYDNRAVLEIVGFQYVPQPIRGGGENLARLRRRLEPFRAVPPVRALLGEVRAAEERQQRGEPGHLAEMIGRLMRVTVARNTTLEVRSAALLHETSRRFGPRSATSALCSSRTSAGTSSKPPDMRPIKRTML